jgi:lipoprotein-anchoring transpeptidase ErfK/SrfK
MAPRPGPTTPHRPAPRPRYGRIASAVSSLAVTTVAVLGASGLIPAVGVAPADGATPVSAATGTSAQAGIALSAFDVPARLWSGDPATDASPEAVSEPAREPEELPRRSGTGKRVVFDMSDQRVWLVGEDGRVRRTYLVSGSLTDNLKPGRYEVYSTSRHAVGIDDSGTMQYMVRFAYGERAAIGFHDIPIDEGRLVQTRAQLGTPQSHGCIRQWRPDARALWYFAIVGTKVVVTA